jgi:hypothetical protein
MKHLSLRAMAVCLFGLALPSLCVLALMAPTAALTPSVQAQSKPPARGDKAPAADEAAPAEFVRRSPLRVKAGPVPERVQAVRGAVLSLDATAAEALKQMDFVRLTSFVLTPELSVDLDLQRADIFADDAVILASRMEGNRVVSQQLPKPDAAILVGKTVDDPDSVVALSISAHGTQGFVNRLGETYIVSTGAAIAQGEPVVFRLDENAVDVLDLGGFECGTDLIPQPNDPAMHAMGGVAGGLGDGTPPCRVARIAIETDHEFLQTLFGGNTGAATAYAATLLAGSSEVFKRDVNVRFQIVFIQLWTSASDPWTAGNTSDQLSQFRDHWQDNFEWIERDVAHFLSGRVLGGGIAWLNALCEDGIDYALSANLVGTFPYPTLMQSEFNWDIIVVTHELGHNFGSPHTHNYNPLIDGCGIGDCTNADQGTLMSYCHQCPGGLANMNIRFHETVIDRILDYLENDTLCNLSDTAGPPDPNNDFEHVAANSANRIDVLRNDLSGDCTTPTIATHDAVTQMGGSVSISTGTGPNGRNELLYTPPNGFTGADQFFYWVGNGGASVVGGQVKVSVLPLRSAENASCTEPGLYAGYYELNNPQVVPNFSLLQPYAGEIVAQINYSSSGGSFAGSGRANDVGAVFVGYLDIPENAAYRVSVLSDDGSKVYLGDELLLNNDGLHGMIEVEAVRALEAGLHELRVEFFENGGDAGLLLTLSGPGLAKQAVPSSMLRRDGALLADFVSSATFAPPGDGVVDGADLAFMLGAWGPALGSPADIVSSAFFLPPADGVIGGADLAYLLGAWGDCD